MTKQGAGIIKLKVGRGVFPFWLFVDPNNSEQVAFLLEKAKFAD
jgi:hypothetical protein